VVVVEKPDAAPPNEEPKAKPDDKPAVTFTTAPRLLRAFDTT